MEKHVRRHFLYRVMFGNIGVHVRHRVHDYFFVAYPDKCFCFINGDLGKYCIGDKKIFIRCSFLIFFRL